ncbi:hypothetical protein LWI28_019154 [Acer negundo]|uniref:Uncharacterized protein n=1 Tax=Acer negundo TaxID=4023 RepID=A0AAD5NVK5_ACENE|nr:hypothetical protein LWI28_019154 [Acer negundo]
MGVRGQRRARRHVQLAPPEFYESDERGIPNRRRYDEDSHTDNDVDELVMGEPRATHHRVNLIEGNDYTSDQEDDMRNDEFDGVEFVQGDDGEQLVCILQKILLSN